MSTIYQKTTITRDLDAGTALAEADRPRGMRPETQRAVATYERALEQSFTVLDPAIGENLQTSTDAVVCDCAGRLAVLEEIARRGRP